ncbi:JmjC domain-containing protein [Streptomyces sp. NPDC059070]|uniref:JmjC domain-containing protein n=1 Tax=Streptomyces sp. NPDC059070 TaxID=3346713 RepID=UPI00369DC5FA
MSSPFSLGQLVGEVEEFLTTTWRRQPAVFRPETAVEPPLTLAGLDAALTTGSLPSCYAQVTRGGATVPAEAYSTPRTIHQTAYPGFVDGAKVRRQLDEGGTLLLRCVEQWHAGTAALTAAVGRELGRKVEAFFFVTPQGRQGLDIHRDDADVLVLQVNGSKQWHVHAGPADGDWQPGPIADGGPELLSLQLQPGEVLYIPRGFAHYATGQDGLSAHLSLTIRETGGAHLYKALQRVLAKGLRLTPRPLDDEALTEQARLLLDHMADRLAATTPEQVVAAARAALLAEAHRSTSPELTALAATLAATDTTGEQPAGPGAPGPAVPAVPVS